MHRYFSIHELAHPVGLVKGRDIDITQCGGFVGFGFVSATIDGKLANMPLENQELTCFTSLLNFMLKIREENKR